ncbi:hypothetical protein Tco_0983698 [Tanacetum coccineum]
MSTQQYINVIRAQRLANTHDPLPLVENTQTPFHPDQSSLITYLQHPQPNNNFVPQPLFNTNYMQQPIQNPEDSSDPTTAMNMALALLAKAFKVNTIPTNNNQRSSLIPRNSQIAQPGMNTSQDIQMQMFDDNVGNQVRQNVVQNDGNEVGQNAVQNPSIQNVENMNGLSVVPEIANQYGNGNVVTTRAEGNGNGINGEEAGIQSTQEEFKFMAAADAYEEIERVKVNCTLEDTLQQASTSGTQSDNAPVYDLDGSAEIERLQAQLGDLKGKSSDTQCASNTLDLVSQKLEDENVSLEFQVRSYAKENEHLKTTYKNLFDSIKVSEQKGTTKGTRTNTMFTKQSILGKPPSSSYKPKLYSVTPFPKSKVLLTVGESNALSKPVSSNSAPSTRESKVVKTVNVIAPRIFMTKSSKTSREGKSVPNKPINASVRTNLITVSQPHVVTKKDANSDSNGLSSIGINITTKNRRPQPRSNTKNDRVEYFEGWKPLSPLQLAVEEVISE